jgi:hypothetical protein
MINLEIPPKRRNSTTMPLMIHPIQTFDLEAIAILDSALMQLPFA